MQVDAAMFEKPECKVIHVGRGGNKTHHAINNISLSLFFFLANNCIYICTCAKDRLTAFRAQFRFAPHVIERYS